MKKFISVLVLVCIMASFCTISAFAADVSTYTELQTAVNDGEDITLTGDITIPENDSLAIPVGANVTIDLNGHSIVGTATKTNHSMILNDGTLTIQGNGNISYKYSGTGDSAFHEGNYTINNRGSLTVKGGTIENLTDLNTPGNVKHCYITIQNTGGLAIYGGTIRCPSYRTVRAFGAGDIFIAGGKFEGQIWVQAPSNGKEHNVKVTITGGSFAPSSIDGSSVFFGAEYGTQKYDVSISGGNFATKIGAGSVTNYTGSGITGGNFADKAALDNTKVPLGDGYEPKANADGTYTVAKPNAQVPEEPAAPEEPKAPVVNNPYEIPSTADNSNMPLWAVLFIGFAAVALLTGKKRRA